MKEPTISHTETGWGFREQDSVRAVDLRLGVGGWGNQAVSWETRVEGSSDKKKCWIERQIVESPV